MTRYFYKQLSNHEETEIQRGTYKRRIRQVQDGRRPEGKLLHHVETRIVGGEPHKIMKLIGDGNGGGEKKESPGLDERLDQLEQSNLKLYGR